MSETPQPDVRAPNRSVQIYFGIITFGHFLLVRASANCLLALHLLLTLHRRFTAAKATPDLDRLLIQNPDALKRTTVADVMRGLKNRADRRSLMKKASAVAGASGASASLLAAPTF
jgi:hypothetical protein